MFHLKIDTRHNTVFVEAPAERAFLHQFTRRWEAVLLATLVDERRQSRALSADTLQARLRSFGQPKPLNRSQLERLLTSVQAFLALLPELQAFVQTPPRKRTVGPWRLELQGALSCAVDGHQAPPPWAHGLIQDQHLGSLHALLSSLLVADALAVEGRYQRAIHALSSLDTAPLSNEGRCLLHLRFAHWHRHLGDFRAARASAESALALPTSNGSALASHAQFFLLRIDYDENPVQNWTGLWESTATEPGQEDAKGADWRTLCEWHNLRALLARRRMHQICEMGGVGTQEETPDAMHHQALRHFQAALHGALWSRDWSTLQAYVTNLTFHLQSCLALPGALGVTHIQVLEWHRLTLAYEEQLGAGLDSAWEYIFFAEFWLNHATRFQAHTAPDPIAQFFGGYSPDQEDFYRQAIKRLRACGDDRQVAIGHSLYLRFAQAHLQGDERADAIHIQSQQLAELLEQQTSKHLLNALIAEGYAQHWPATLLRQARRLRRPNQGSP